MVFVDNINQSVDTLLKTSNLFVPFPPEIGTDTAFLDRFHCYLPGWKVPKFSPEHFTDDYGFISDYLAEFVRELRKTSCGDAIEKYFKLGKTLNQRDTIAVRHTVSGLLKLIYPDGIFTKDEVEETEKSVKVWIFAQTQSSLIIPVKAKVKVLKLPNNTPLNFTQKDGVVKFDMPLGKSGNKDNYEFTEILLEL